MQKYIYIKYSTVTYVHTHTHKKAEVGIHLKFEDHSTSFSSFSWMKWFKKFVEHGFETEVYLGVNVFLKFMHRFCTAYLFHEFFWRPLASSPGQNSLSLFLWHSLKTRWNLQEAVKPHKSQQATQHTGSWKLIRMALSCQSPDTDLLRKGDLQPKCRKGLTHLKIPTE